MTTLLSMDGERGFVLGEKMVILYILVGGIFLTLWAINTDQSKFARILSDKMDETNKILKEIRDKR